MRSIIPKILYLLYLFRPIQSILNIGFLTTENKFLQKNKICEFLVKLIREYSLKYM